MTALLVPRVALRLTQTMPALPKGNFVEHLAAKASHFAMYFFMFALPGTGIAMGYFGGKGIPFFDFGTVPGAETPNKAIAGDAFKKHKQLGELFT